MLHCNSSEKKKTYLPLYLYVDLKKSWGPSISLDVTVFNNLKFKLSEDAFKVTYQVVALIVFVILGKKDIC